MIDNFVILVDKNDKKIDELLKNNHVILFTYVTVIYQKPVYLKTWNKY